MFETSLVMEERAGARQGAMAATVSLAMELTVLAALVLIPLYYSEGIRLQIKPPEMPLRAPSSDYTTSIATTNVPAAMRGDNLFHLTRTTVNSVPFAPHAMPGNGAWRTDANPLTDPAFVGLGPGVGGGASPFGRELLTEPARQTVAVAPAHKLKVSGGVAEGLLLRKVVPEYPELAKRIRVEGTVTMAALIGRDGRIEQLHVLSGQPMLSRAAMDAVNQWIYKPYMLNGAAVEVETTITVNFRLSGGQ